MPSRRIAQLSQDVVDKIAAGEVVVRPVNAVKELIENSLDAGATEINVSISSGGLDLIRIQDNGHGIAKDDLPIACQRFTTSKLKAYEDLRQIITYGFRGEALASISYVANLTITTRTSEDKCAYKATYKEGKMVGQISQSAGLPGTTINVEKLFKNMPHRLATFRQPTEEANRIADLLVRYAIHNPSVSFAYRRMDGTGYNFRSTGNGDQHGTIRTLMHEKASKDLVNVEFHDTILHFSAKACLATPAAVFTSRAVQARHDKLKVFHLFINNRSVECPRLQRSFDAVFTAKDSLCPFISLALQIQPERVDVNVHPTKSMVHFLNEDAIIERIANEFDKFLAENRTRNTIQIEDDQMDRRRPLLTNGNGRKRNAPTTETPFSNEVIKSAKMVGIVRPSLSSTSTSTAKTVKVAPKHKIRVDYTNRSLDEFLLNKDDLENPLRPTSQVQIFPLMDVTMEEDEEARTVEKTEEGSANNPINLEKEEETMSESLEEMTTAATMKGTNKTPGTTIKCTPRHFNFDSLVDLRKEICQNVNRELMEVFKRHLLIGFFDTRHALIQSGANVFLVRNDHVLRQFFYQLIIFSFGNMGAYDLHQSDNPRDFLPIRDLLHLYLHDGNEQKTTKKIDRHCEVLMKHRNMLWNYFSIKILANFEKKDDPTSSSCSPLLASIPCLIEGYMAEHEGLPYLLYRLSQIDYSNEKECFCGIALALAEFHVPFMENDDGDNKEGKDGKEEEEEGNLHRRRAQRAIRARIFPALRNRFLPAGNDIGEHVQMLTSTAQAFKHFGRC